MGKPRGSQALPNHWNHLGFFPREFARCVSVTFSMAVFVAYGRHSYQQSSGFLRTPRHHHSYLQSTYLEKKKKKKECNPVHTEVPQPMEMYRALNPNKGCMSSKTTVPGKLSIKTCSHARAMSQVLHLKSADFKSSTNLRNCANKISPLPS